MGTPQVLVVQLVTIFTFTCLVAGKGIVLDYVEAYKWFHLAAAQNGPSQQDAVKACKLLTDSMTPNQIAEAKRRAVTFVPRKKSGK